jgi:hypothetical protein
MQDRILKGGRSQRRALRVAIPFSLTKLAFGHSGKGSAVPCVEEHIIAQGLATKRVQGLATKRVQS